jgi:hypothetical protein
MRNLHREFEAFIVHQASGIKDLRAVSQQNLYMKVGTELYNNARFVTDHRTDMLLVLYRAIRVGIVEETHLDGGM